MRTRNHIVVEVSPALKAQLRSEATKEGVKLSKYVRNVLQSHLDRISEQAATPTPVPQKQHITDDIQLYLDCPF